MHVPELSIHIAPYGIAFELADLIVARNWAERGKLGLHIALDHVLDNLEFEEMLILTLPRRHRRILTVWRTQSGIFAQTAEGRPRPFPSVELALQAYQPAPTRRSVWLKKLGLAS